MDEASKTGIEFTEVTKHEWWVGLLEQGKNWHLGGAFALFIGPQSCYDAAAAWFISAVCTAQEDGKPFFAKTMVVLPAGNGNTSYRDRLVERISVNYGNKTESKAADLKIETKFPHCFLEESDSANVLTKIEQLPDRSAVGICLAQLLRFAGLLSAAPVKTTTHTGFTIAQSTLDQLTLPHLYELMRRLLVVAGEKKLSIVLFVEEFVIDPARMPEDLREHKELALLSTQDDAAAVAVYHAKLQAEQIRREKGLDIALDFIKQNLGESRHRAHASLLVLGAEGLWFEAWKRVRPDIQALLDMRDPNISLILATTASACGEADEALKALENAIELGLDTIENLNTAAFIAREIRAWSALDKIIPMMLSSFASHPYTFTQSYHWLVSNGHFAKASKLAKKNGDAYKEAWAKLLGQPEPEWNAFLDVAKSVEMLTEGLGLVARHSLQRGDIEKTKEFLNQIPRIATNAHLRVGILADLVSKEIHFEQDLGKVQIQLTEIFGFLALNPSETDIRNQVATAIESAEDVTSRTILIVCCWDAFRRSEKLFEPSNATTQKSLFGSKVDEQIMKETTEFIQEVQSNKNCRMFGKGLLPSKYTGGVTDGIMTGLGLMVQRTTEKPDFDMIKLELQCLNVACTARKEAAWDFQAAIQLLSRMVASGSSSDAFNLAEAITSFWPDSIPELKSERLSHAWSCVADVYHRSRNNLMAMMHLALCFESMALRPAQQHVSMLKQKLRLTARVFRDFEINDYARAALARELRLVDKFPERNRESKEILTTNISLEMRGIDENTSQDAIFKIIQMCRDLLNDPHENEWGMPVSIGVNLLNLCRIYGKAVPDGFRELVYSKIAKCPSRYQNLFHRFLKEKPSITDIEGMMSDLAMDNVQDDQGYRFEMVNGILRRAIKVSCDEANAELFLAAASWLSQPSLSASRITWQDSGDRPVVNLAKVTELFPIDSDASAERMRDYGLAMERQIEKTESNFAKVPPLPLSASRYVTATNEALCFLVYDSELHLCRLVVKQDGTEGPVRIPEEDWDHTLYLKWLERFPEMYSWDRFYEAFGERDEPSINTIRSSLEKLQPHVPTDSAVVTILPEATLFGFSYFLNEQEGRRLGEIVQCCTAPSLSWLAAVRKMPQPKLNSIKAWLGHPTLADFGVLRPRGELTPILQKYGAEILVSETPQPLKQADIGIVLSHGSRGASSGFVGVNDVGRFTSRELAHWLGECTCVVLFVCNAGRSDRKLSNNETFGLIGQLLRRDVRTVIAPPAPIRIDLPGIWLEPFLAAMRRGETVAEAHAAASAVIRTKFDHPCAWGALQLFGDPCLRFH